MTRDHDNGVVTKGLRDSTTCFAPVAEPQNDVQAVALRKGFARSKDGGLKGGSEDDGGDDA